MGSHLVGPWHLVGATMENTLDLNRIVRAIGWELNPVKQQPDLDENYVLPVLSLAGCYDESRYVQLAKLDIPFHW